MNLPTMIEFQGRLEQLSTLPEPYASWQRGTNENRNDGDDRLWAKRFDLATLADGDIQNGVFILNLTPRKVLDALTPLEAFTGHRVALVT